MDRESIKQLELDVRMLQRRRWITPEELQKRLAALPDVADKAAPAEVEPASGED